MITFIRGRLVEKTPTELVVDVNGVGYQIFISLYTYSKISDSEEVMIFTYLQVKEDSHTLYGFCDKKERNLFSLLISVSGIGANTARNMLSYIHPDELMQAIVNEDVKKIQGIKGIGLKTAQRTVIELREKVLKISDTIQVQTSSANAEEALSALEVLGLDKKRADKAIREYLKKNEQASVEELIKYALKNI